MASIDQVESIVVLMLENRSFDNLLGYLYYADGNKSPSGDSFDGLTGNETNPKPKGAPPPDPVKVSSEKSISTTPDPDPGEEFAHVNMQLFSTTSPAAGAKATNQGFILDYDQVLQEDPKSSAQVEQIMRCYDPAMLPSMTAIARQSAVCDAWFASVPSQTWPNRSFVHAASSNGHVNNAPNNPLLWHIPTVFNVMSGKNSWLVYYDEFFVSLTRLQMSQLWPIGYSKNFQPFSRFLHDANAGRLPNYAFIEPNFFPNPVTGAPPNDQHPNHDVAVGDAFVGQVFNAIITSPLWAANKVLFVITYDEHGGCFDHVPPPDNAIPPAAGVGDYGFDFSRFGVRVPAIVVSPFVRAGSVFRAPAGSPAFDHTSILATVERRFGLSPLSERDKKAPDLSSVLSLDIARTDFSPVPIALIAASAPSSVGALGAPLLGFPAPAPDILTQPLNDLQQSIVNAMQFASAAQAPAFATPGAQPPLPAGAAPPPPVRTVGEAFAFIRNARRTTGI